MIKDSNKKQKFCILGRTSSGKTKLTEKVAEELNLTILKSYTTREMREDEINKLTLDHTFITDAIADELLEKDEVVAYTEINNPKKVGKTRYFATLTQLRNADFYIIDPEGLHALEATIKNWGITDIELVPIYISSTKKVRKERFISRDNCTEDDFKKRDDDENNQFNRYELKIMDKDKKFLTSIKTTAHIIKNNGKFDDALIEYKKIINSCLTK